MLFRLWRFRYMFTSVRGGNVYILRVVPYEVYDEVHSRAVLLSTPQSVPWQYYYSNKRPIVTRSGKVIFDRNYVEGGIVVQDH